MTVTSGTINGFIVYVSEIQRIQRSDVVCETIIMSQPYGEGAISVAFVCPSVCLSVRRVHSE